MPANPALNDRCAGRRAPAEPPGNNRQTAVVGVVLPPVPYNGPMGRYALGARAAPQGETRGFP